MSQLNRRTKTSQLNIRKTVAQLGLISGAWNLVTWQQIIYDNENEYVPAPTYGFRPRKSGYYFVHAQVMWSAQAGSTHVIGIYFNGVLRSFSAINVGTVQVDASIAVTDIIYLTPNDLIQIYSNYVSVNPAAGDILATNQADYFIVQRI